MNITPELSVPHLGALHLGALHAHEQVWVLVLAFGPFVLLGLVIAVRHRQDRLAEPAEEPASRQRER